MNQLFAPFSRCCSTVCWGDPNHQSKDNRDKKENHQPPALCTIWQIIYKKKKLLLLSRWSRIPAALPSVDWTQICFTESEKTFVWLFLTQLLQFLLLPQTSLGGLIKQPGLPGYCLFCLINWAVKFSTWPPNNTTTPSLANTASVPVVGCPAGPGVSGP